MSITGPEHIRRYETLKGLRQPFEQYWLDAYNATFPIRGQGFVVGSAQNAGGVSGAADKKADILDSTLKLSCRLLASALLSGLTPSNSRWFGQEIFGLKSEAADKWLDEAADMIWQMIHNSNYDITAYESLIDYSVAGMFAMFVEEGDLKQGKLYNFQTWPLSSLYFADSSNRGMIDTIYRHFNLTAEQAIKTYDPKLLSQTIVKDAEKKPDEKHEFLQAIYPRTGRLKANELPIASEHIEIRSKAMVRKSGYYEQPVIVPRWLPATDSVYSLGPADDAMPDYRTLNEVIRLNLANADMNIAGALGVVDDGVINPKSIVVGPRMVIPVASKDSIFPIKSGGDFNLAQLEINRLQSAIRQVMMTDQLNPEHGPQMTATEIVTRTQQLRQLLGPMFGRLQAEFLTPLVERCFSIAIRAGVLTPPPQEVQEKIAKVSYKSPLAKSQKLEDVANIERFENTLAMLAKSGLIEPLDNYDMDLATREKAKLMGVPLELIRDEEAVKKLREDRAAAQKEALKQQQMAAMQEKTAPIVAKGMVENAA